IDPEDGPAAGAEFIDDGAFVAVAAVAGEVDDQAAVAPCRGLVETHPRPAEVDDPGGFAVADVGLPVTAGDGGPAAAGLLGIGLNAGEEARALRDGGRVAGGAAVEADDAAAVEAAVLDVAGCEPLGGLDDAAVVEDVVLNADGQDVRAHVD